MELRKLGREEHFKTRKLWETIFKEDTKEFLDYYYSVKTARNEIYVIEEDEQIVSMLHLNPYDLRINENTHPANYIVAVATDQKYRKRGYMGQLLKKAMRVMYGRKEPFTFLMPAAEAIYYPYDFRFIYSRNQGEMCGKKSDEKVEILPVTQDECGKLAEFANNILETYQVAANRNVVYYQTLIAEQKSCNGNVMWIQKEGKKVGSFCYAKGDSYEVREPLFEKEEDFLNAVYLLTQSETEVVKCFDYGEEKRPIIMARILHLETFLKCLKLEQDVDMFLALEDRILEENDGVFHIVGTVEEGVSLVEKQTGFKGQLETIPIGDFTKAVFEKYLPKVFLNEVV